MKTVHKSFKFENMWIADDSCRKVIEETWKQRNIGDFKALAEMVARCGMNLTKWNKTHYSNLQMLIKGKQKEL